MMGHLYKHNIKPGGVHVLSLLHSEKVIRYSRFYDGTTETQEAVAKAVGSDYPEEVAILMDIAIGQLTDHGYVSVTLLSEKLADGEPDYEIRLTPLGVQAVEENWNLPYGDVTALGEKP